MGRGGCIHFISEVLYTKEIVVGGRGGLSSKTTEGGGVVVKRYASKGRGGTMIWVGFVHTSIPTARKRGGKCWPQFIWRGGGSCDE